MLIVDVLFEAAAPSFKRVCALGETPRDRSNKKLSKLSVSG